MTRPTFRAAKAVTTTVSPEELFGKLPNRAQSHSYLRAPQVDALRAYMASKDASDIALELPTGTGKTSVGLLIAEWHRRKEGCRVAYIAPTNQLVSQVLLEAQALGIACADLRGTKLTRNVTEVGKYNAATAVGISTYSNLFNVKPVLDGAGLVILDDAHGGEQFVTGMWTVSIQRATAPDLYNDVLAALAAALGQTRLERITDEAEYDSVILADTRRHPECLPAVKARLEQEESPEIRFPWSLISSHLKACFILISYRSIVIRPIIIPTHTHNAFSEAKQRIFMSATLGGEGDLMRSYAITSLATVRAQHPQWGNRYVFAPGLVMSDEASFNLVASVWEGVNPKRMLMLAPSTSILDDTYNNLDSRIPEAVTRITANDISDSLYPFTSREDAILTVANRYDGLDLPDDDCRLMVMSESPSAIGALEKHQRMYWKLGPLLREKEQARLTQGMGRCTRGATDYAVILLLGQSLIDSTTRTTTQSGLPIELQRELKWAKEQLTGLTSPEEELKSIVEGLLSDSQYRADANETIADTPLSEPTQKNPLLEKGAREEVKFFRALWDSNYSAAYKIAREIADLIVDKDLAGYRAWLLYIASIAASQMGDTVAEHDSLLRSRGIGVNSGFFDQLLREGSKPVELDNNSDAIVIERIWDNIEHKGWQGPKFGEYLKTMIGNLSNYSTANLYHLGLEHLGKCLGAEALRSTDSGAPDCIWIFPEVAYTFESKAGKQDTSKLSKHDIQQANGHPAWLRSKRPELAKLKMIPYVVATNSDVAADAAPHVAEAVFIPFDGIKTLAENTSERLKELRVQFAGGDYGGSRAAFEAQVRLGKLMSNSWSEFLGQYKL